jgi:hypothetical protein
MEAIIISAFNFIYQIITFLLSLWWIFIPLILFPFARDLWTKYKRDQAIQNLEWTILEIIPPQEIKKTPYAMEQFFASLHGAQTTPNWWDRNIKGDTQKWFSFEMVSLSGEIHFFAYIPSGFRNFVEAQIYAQYPNAEVVESQDYTDVVPQDIPDEEYNTWGTELMFAEPFPYPIRTYPVFGKDVLEAEERIDPLSSILETMSNLKGGENIWIQVLARPIGGGWKKKGEKIRDQILGREEVKKPSKGLISGAIEGFFSIIQDTINHIITGKQPEAPKAEEKKEKPSLSKGEEEKVKAIESKIDKLGYETIIRFIYIGQKDVFDMGRVPAIMGNFKQLNTQNLNSFRPNLTVTPRINYRVQGKHQRELVRKKRVLFDYRRRFFPQYSSFIGYLSAPIFYKLPGVKETALRYEPMVMNIEELATVFHLPSISVEAPFVPQVEAKKGEPPRTLPTE